MALLFGFTLTTLAQIGTPATVFSTANGTVAQLVTNKVITTAVVALPNKQIDCTQGTKLALEVSFQWVTTWGAGTNVVLSFSKTGHATNLRTNRDPNYLNWTITGSGATNTYTTNLTVDAYPYVYLDTLTPTGSSITNLKVSAYVKP